MNRDLYKAFAYNYILSYKDNNNYLDKIQEQLYIQSFKKLNNCSHPFFVYKDKRTIPDNIESINIVTVDNDNNDLYNKTNIKHVHFNFRFNSIVRSQILPDSIEHIVYDADNFLSNFTIGSLPKSLKKLEITHNKERNSNKFYSGIFPDSIEKLRLGYYFDQPITADILPKNLKLLSIYHNFREYMNELPNNLFQLSIHSTSDFDENDYMNYFRNELSIPCIVYNNSSFRITHDIIIQTDLCVITAFDNFIEDYLNGTKKLIGQIIFEELLFVVLNNNHIKRSI